MSDNSSGCGGGIGLGSIIALLLSWFHWHSIWWLIPAGICGWGYVIYHLIRYGVQP
jgi:hypothetical protein